MAARDCDVCGGRGYVNEVCPSCNGSLSNMSMMRDVLMIVQHVEMMDI
ncbi:MAG: hypothetical protein UZ01_00390 [Candidatus Brocadia sinica]|nr:MAG: hypothetical protein UZ01_00390 [Candidatus Brocadia sinica]NUO10012.1 hypothetical protein [Candidatus Brocadia sp.]